MRRRDSLLLVLPAALVLSACFTTAADFSTDAEKHIETTVAESVGVEFEVVECEEPLSQDVGTRFACTATDVDGGEWTFDNEISAKNEFTINIDRSP
jgi:hypothetical protein